MKRRKLLNGFGLFALFPLLKPLIKLAPTTSGLVFDGVVTDIKSFPYALTFKESGYLSMCFTYDASKGI